MIFFSRSDQFIKDFSFKFEGDFNFFVNFFRRDFVYKIEVYFFEKMIGKAFVKLKGFLS